MDVSSNTVVVTGFGAFRQHLVNSSWEAAKELLKLGLGKDVNLHIIELPVVYQKAKVRVCKAWETLNPQEVTCLKKQSTGDVNVEVNTCPGPDLKKILEEMRCKYEAMIEGNRKEVESWYESKIEEVNRDVNNSSQEIEESNNKVTELRRQLQALQIEYEAQCSLRDTLESSLGETELRYNNHLGELQERISRLEQQLAELRSEMECQNHDYTELLDVKSRLEQEIATYRGLLEGGQHEITYLCDYVYYTSLYYGNGRAAFIHLPPLTKWVTAEFLGNVLQKIILEVLKQCRSENM